jgi:NitT/TauT family transport system substrate-binding protein
MTKKILVLSLVAFLALAVVFTGCGTPENAQADSKTPFKVGALSMITVLPLYGAQQEGLFADQGLNVEIVPFRSQVDRDTALSVGQLDCIIEDIYSVPILNKNNDLIKVVAVSPVQGYMFAIVASKPSDIHNVADLKSTEIASSLGNIIEYVTDQMCAQGGLKDSEIKKTSVPSMPLRLEMMNQEKIGVATFSRPLSDMALLAGGRIICDDSRQSLLTSSIMVSSGSLKARPGDIKKFLGAWTLATEKISSDPARYRSLLVKVAAISADIADKIEVPGFTKPRLPTPEEYNSKMEWNMLKKNIDRIISYQDIVAKGYLP